MKIQKKNDTKEIKIEKTKKQKIKINGYKKIRSKDFEKRKIKEKSKVNKKEKDEYQENKFLKNSMILLIGKFSTQFISMLLIPIFTYYLSKEDYGAVDLLQTYVYVSVPVLLLSIDSGVFRFLVEKRNDGIGVKKIITNSLIFTVIQIGIIGAFGLLIGGFIGSTLYMLALAKLLVSMLSYIVVQISRGLGEYTKYTMSAIIASIVNVFANVILIVVLKLGGISIFISSIIANIVTIIYIVHKTKMLKFIDFKLKNKKLVIELLKYSIPMLPNTLSWWIVNASDKTIIAMFLGTASNGIYSIASKFSNILNGILSIIILAWQETATMNINDKNKDKFFSKNIEDTFVLFTTIIAAVMVFLSFAFEHIVGVNYSEAYKYIPILLVSLIFTVLSSLYGGIYVAKKLSKEISKTSLASSGINIILNLITIPKFGLYGAAVSTLVSYLLLSIYRIIDSKKYVKVKFQKFRMLLIVILTVSAVMIYYIHNFWIGVFASVIYSVLVIYINKGMIKDLIYILKKKVKNNTKLK